MGIVEWAKTERVGRAWGEVAERWGLRNNELWDVERLFMFTEGAFKGTEIDFRYVLCGSFLLLGPVMERMRMHYRC
jgi:hypothetical protein